MGVMLADLAELVGAWALLAPLVAGVVYGLLTWSEED